jgi:hypothetical protein
MRWKSRSQICSSRPRPRRPGSAHRSRYREVACGRGCQRREIFCVKGTCTKRLVLYLECMNSFHAKNLWHLRLTLRWTPNLGVEGQEQYWDALVIWCAQHDAYLGGTPNQAIVLTRSAGAPLQRKLHKWLSGWAASGHHFLDHAKTQWEAEIQPDRIADDLWRKAVASI